MGQDRFKQILKYFRFDLKKNKISLPETDQFALASEIWNIFIENSLLCYKSGESITIDKKNYSHARLVALSRNIYLKNQIKFG